MADQREAEDDQGVDPIEFLKRALAISPEDAIDVREQAAGHKKAGPEETEDAP